MLIDRTLPLCVTGCSGFIGSYVLEELKNRNYSNIIPLYGRKDLDLSDSEAVSCFFEKHNIQYFLSLAAKCGGITSNAASPISYFMENIEQGMNVLYEAYTHNVKRFLLLSTICAYPSETTCPFKESDLWLGREEITNRPYAVAKKSLQVLLESMKPKMDGVCVLLGNSFGVRDNFNENGHIIPQIIMRVQESIEKNEDLVVFGSGDPTRTFTFASDSASGIVDMFENYNGEGPVNIGSDQEYSIYDTVCMICDIMGYDKNRIKFDKTKPNGQMRRKLCIDKAKKYGWSPKIGLQEGLEATIKWYKEQL